MREIKFRAWVTYPCAYLKNGWQEGTCMAIVQSLNLSTGTMRLKSLTEGFAPSNGGSFDIKRDYGKCHALMQYTGLKDKNGKEIYEGDVVETIKAGKKIKFEVFWDDAIASFNRTLSYNLLSNEVIGNIYENPELIK